MQSTKSTLVIEPNRSWGSLDIRELWAHRELLYFLTWRDVIGKYRQTVMGAFWAILTPLSQLVVFSWVFGSLGRMPSGGVPYAVFNYVGICVWLYFSTLVTAGVGSVVGNAHVFTKVYFPRVIMPLARVGDALVSFLISLTLFPFLMLWYAVPPSLTLIALPVFVALITLLGLGLGLWLGALNVKHRDIGHGLPFVFTLWFYITPILYPLSLVSPNWQWVYGLNPVVGALEGFRWSLIPGWSLNWLVVAESVVITIVLLYVGLRMFRRMESSFADVV